MDYSTNNNEWETVKSKKPTNFGPKKYSSKPPVSNKISHNGNNYVHNVRSNYKKSTVNNGKSLVDECNEFLNQFTSKVNFEKVRIFLESDSDKKSDKMGEIGYRIIRDLPIKPYYYELVKQFIDEGYLTKKQVSEYTGFSLYNAVAWYESETPISEINKVIDILKSIRCNIFTENKRQETAIDSLMEAFNKQKINQKQMEERYFLICSINENQAKRIIAGILNKLDNNPNKKNIDRIRFCMMDFAQTFINIFVKALITRKIKPTMETDNSIKKFIDLFQKASMAPIINMNLFYKGKTSESELDLFFQQNKSKLKTTTELMNLFINKLGSYCFDKNDEANEHQKLEWEAGAIVIGELARDQLPLERYFKFVSGCLTNNDQEFECQKNQSDSVRLTIALKAICQKQIFDDKTKYLLANAYFNMKLNEKEKWAILNLFDQKQQEKKHSNLKQTVASFRTTEKDLLKIINKDSEKIVYVVKEKNQNKQRIEPEIKKRIEPEFQDQIEIFNKKQYWKSDDENLLDELQYDLEKFINIYKKSDLIENLILVLIEKFDYHKNKEQILKSIIQLCLRFLDNNEFFEKCNAFKKENLNDFKYDSPNVEKTFEIILNLQKQI